MQCAVLRQPLFLGEAGLQPSSVIRYLDDASCDHPAEA